MTINSMVFLCHSKDDKSKVRNLYRRLLDSGFNVWFDEENLLPGQDWELEIRQAIRESKFVIVCISNSSTTKTGYVQKELRMALDIADEQPEGAIYLIPVRLDNCKVPNRLAKWQWLNLFEADGYARLEVVLGKSKNQDKLTPVFTEPEMLRIPRGKFLMGSTEEQGEQAIKTGIDKSLIQYEQPSHTVNLSEYFISKFPVTNSEYQVFIKSTKHRSPLDWIGGQFPLGLEKHPVVNISWDDAVSYCNWLSAESNKAYRLPTEAEWEKAARSTDARIFPWGNDFNPNKANTYEARIGNISEVGSFSPSGDSPYGCADMSGNVWEWCADWFDEAEYKNRGTEVINPLGPQHGIDRVLRGGSFLDSRRSARCAYRNRFNPFDYNNNLGFRVAFSVKRK